ncbi:hypothetical protein AB4Z43_08410 [Mesorhizobium sp. 2RAF45]|uniref:hypothetical protein n=1 Tax=Mesorhizobium sp. 2RAF45 TaxID=3233001 RepID=UPI003F9D2756
MPKVGRTLEYRRVRWLAAGHSLEQFLRQAWGHFPTQHQRTVVKADGSSVCGLRSRQYDADGFAIQCARYTANQSIGVLSMVPAPDAEVGERPPDADENFLNADFMALVRGNHVIVMNAGRNAAALGNYLRGLFNSAGLPNHTTQFELSRVGDLDKLAMIENIGVKAVALRVDIAEASAVELIDGAGPDTIWNRAKRAAASTLGALIAQDDQLARIREAEAGTVTVSINIKKGDLLAAKTGLDHLGYEVAEDEEADDFLIQLRDGQSISPDEVAVRKRVSVDAIANSVSADEAWTKMRQYMQELAANGQLEA